MAKLKESAWLILVDGDGHILLSRRSKYVNNPGLFNFAGGSIDKGESPKKAAIREAKEELGFDVKKGDVTKVGKLATEKATMHFYITRLSCRPKLKPNAEVDKLVWVTQNKLKTYALHKPTLFCINHFFNSQKGAGETG